MIILNFLSLKDSSYEFIILISLFISSLSIIISPIIIWIDFSFFIISFTIELIFVDKLYFLFFSLPKCNPIIFEIEFLSIIGEPDAPFEVGHVCFIIFPSIDSILPLENNNSLLYIYCNINISLSYMPFIFWDI